MYYYKILKNKYKTIGGITTYLYGGLNVDLIKISNFNGEDMVACTSENIKNENIKQITREEFFKLIDEIDKNKKSITQSIDKEKETFTQTLAELTIEDKKKDVMIANLAETVANLTIQVNKMKGSAQ